MADLFDIDHGSLRDRVLALLWDLNWHGNAALARVGGVRYNARVHELRRLGYRIDDESDGRADGKRYRLVSQEPTGPLTKRVKVFLQPRRRSRAVG